MTTKRSEYLPDDAEETPPVPPNGKQPVPRLMYEAIKFDERIPAGAFRLWHILKDLCLHNQNHFCWPGIRRLAAQMHSSDMSITAWRKKLVACGYLQVEVISKANAPASRKLGGFIYRVGEVPLNDGQQTLDSFYRTLNTGRNNPDGKTWTQKNRHKKADVDTDTQGTCTPQPPEGTSTARSARIDEGEKSVGMLKPFLSRRSVVERLREIETEISDLKKKDSNYARRLAPPVVSDLAWIEKHLENAKDEKTAQSLREEAERRRVNPASYIRGEMTAGAKQILETKRAEQNQIKAWLAKKVKDAVEDSK